MSAQGNIVINDGTSPTPVARTFAPKGARVSPDKKEVAIWRDQSTASAVGYRTLTEQHTPVNSNGMEKFRISLDIPTLESANSGGLFAPPPTRAYGTIGVVEVWVHQRASAEELANIVAYVKNVTASAYFTNLITNREASW